MSVVTTTILSSGKQINGAYQLVSIDIIKEVNRIPYAQLVLIDGDGARQEYAISNTSDFNPGKSIEIKLRYEETATSEVTVFKGLVVGQRVEAGRQGSLLTVEMKDAAVRMSRTRKSMVYRRQTDDKVIGTIIASHGLKKGRISATQPQHAELVQYYCNDWDFMLSRAEANGLLVLVEDGTISLRAIAIAGKVQRTFEYGIDDQIFDFEIEEDAASQYPDVHSIAWDAKNQKPTSPAKAKPFTLAQGKLSGKQIAGLLDTTPLVLRSTAPLGLQELQSWADAMLTRSRLAMLRGRIGIAGTGKLKLMDLIKISGIGDRFNGETLVTGIRHRVDQDGWRTDVQFGIPVERYAERPDIVDVPAAGLVPAVNGLQIGVVDQFEQDPAKELRVKVILPGIDEKRGAVWARLAALDAGAGHGFFFRPEPGDEVVVGFFNDDPRQAVILGAMHSSKNAPPDALSQVTEKNTNKAIVTKTGTMIRFVDDTTSALFIQTPASNVIKLDDDKQEIRISDQHGNMITMSKDGIQFKSAKDLKIEATGNVEIKGRNVDVK